MPRSIALVLALVGLAPACGAPEPTAPPSLALIVIDTLRADAVSSYGGPRRSTPNLDRLAAKGLVYRQAYAPAPWTLPSHATLLTGVGPAEHGVGLHGRMALPDTLTTLAERLSEAGYATAGFSENPVVSHDFGFARGFDHFGSVPLEDVSARDRGSATRDFDAVARIGAWLERRPPEKPFFLFVNLFDAHDPYELRAMNPFLPEGTSPERARQVLEGPGRMLEMCRRLPGEDTLAVLRGLYLGDVAAADAKLREIVELLQTAAAGSDLVTVVTSDHGEHLGEHRLLGHEFSVRNVLLHVPLVVHGLPGVRPATLDTPVALADVPASLLSWAGAPGAGRSLPTRNDADADPRTLLAAYSDAAPVTPDRARPVVELNSRKINQQRVWCVGAEPVFGDMATAIRAPHKLIWYQNAPAQLYDLSEDPGEQRDRIAERPALAAELSRELDAFREAVGWTGEAPAPPPERDSEDVEASRVPGYLDGVD
ncbi:MAG: sulfatase [Deltaproteobacteria bacterium]|nr:sulfatase [Deltaproteobacteria bacterium]